MTAIRADPRNGLFVCYSILHLRGWPRKRCWVHRLFARVDGGVHPGIYTCADPIPDCLLFIVSERGVSILLSLSPVAGSERGRDFG
jgi:hypothetical protein